MDIAPCIAPQVLVTMWGRDLHG
ncbi:MAG: hypothetical protein ACD_36C00175G0001, partial [uncultured bacterium]